MYINSFLLVIHRLFLGSECELNKDFTDKMILKTDNLIEKRNLLNEMKSSYMTLQEMRLFSIYLSKINPRNISTKEVVFPLSDFLKIMDIDRVRIEKLKLTTNRLLSKIINVSNDDGGYTAFQLFEKCQVYKDKISDNWFIKIIAHKDALPLMFDFKEQYFKYELWNALSLGSTNQIRMYEILKQYEKRGQRIIELDELKKMLGIDLKQYPRFNSFRERVLESAKTALEKYTDIKFTYETICIRGRKVSKIKFYIYKNKAYTCKMSLKEFMSNKKLPEIIKSDNDTDDEYDLYSEVFEGEFNRSQLELLTQLALPIMRAKGISGKNECVTEMANYFRLTYKRLKASPTDVKYPFAYVKKIISLDVDAFSDNIM
ncbi:replication initiation protein [bacterium]|nr:replication initiation protein [bacterium]